MCEPVIRGDQTFGLDTIMTEDRCALGNSLDQYCLCKNASQCRDFIITSYNESIIQYPASGPMLSPFAYMLYVRDSDWIDKKPNKMMLFGQAKCLGYHMARNTPLTLTFSETILFYCSRIFEQAICTAPLDDFDYRNRSGVHYDVYCWNNSTTFALSNKMHVIISNTKWNIRL